VRNRRNSGLERRVAELLANRVIAKQDPEWLVQRKKESEGSVSEQSLRQIIVRNPSVAQKAISDEYPRVTNMAVSYLRSAFNPAGALSHRFKTSFPRREHDDE
jgi:hypothetical protein